jgi:hypothetical protein
MNAQLHDFWAMRFIGQGQLKSSAWVPSLKVVS